MACMNSRFEVRPHSKWNNQPLSFEYRPFWIDNASRKVKYSIRLGGIWSFVSGHPCLIIVFSFSSLLSASVACLINVTISSDIARLETISMLSRSFSMPLLVANTDSKGSCGLVLSFIYARLNVSARCICDPLL